MELLLTMALSAADDSRVLARGLRARDPRLLDELIEKFQYRLLRYLVALAGNHALAEDLFQETWLRVLERGHQFDPRYRFEPWLFAVARNLFLDRVRRRPELSLTVSEDDEEIPLDPADVETRSPFEEARHSEQKRALTGALATLAPIYREVLALRFQEELSLEEIARVSNVPVSTVKSRLYRGLGQMQLELGRTGVAL